MRKRSNARLSPASAPPYYTNYDYYYNMVNIFRNPIALDYNAYDDRRKEHGFRWSHIWGPFFEH